MDRLLWDPRVDPAARNNRGLRVATGHGNLAMLDPLLRHLPVGIKTEHAEEAARCILNSQIGDLRDRCIKLLETREDTCGVLLANL